MWQRIPKKERFGFVRMWNGRIKRITKYKKRKLKQKGNWKINERNRIFEEK